jgi:uncharacterized repeat protein (TIGR02543 family)
MDKSRRGDKRMKKLSLIFTLMFMMVFASFLTANVVFAEEIEETATITYVVSEEVLAGLEDDLVAPAPVTGPVGTVVQHIPTLSSAVYTFLGWYYYDDLGNQVQHKKYDVITEDLTLYGAWRLTPRVVSYDLSGGTNNALNPFIVYANETYVLEPAMKFGHDFVGWLLNDEFVTSLENVTRGVRLTAVFEASEVTLNVILDNDDEDYALTLTFGESYALVEPSKVGFDFAGWLDQDLNVFLATGVVDFEETTTVTAQWTPRADTEYTVITYFEKLDGTFDSSEVIMTGTTLSLVELEPADVNGFVLNLEESELSGVIAADGSLVLEVYYNRALYTVTFLDENGEVITTEQVKFEGSATAPSYEVPGFDASFDESEFDFVTEDVEVEVILTGKTYEITFDQEDIDPISAVFNEVIGTLPVADAPEDFVFNGWKDAEGKFYTSTSIYDVVGDLALFADFIPETDVEYTVQYRFENEEGVFVVDETRTLTLTETAGETVTAPQLDVVPEGYQLFGELPSGVVTSAGDGLVLVVDYERVTLVVTFVYYEDGEIEETEVEVKFGLTVVAPTVPERLGYDFDGWDASLENIVESQMITAVYELVEYQINFFYMDEDSFDDKAVHVGQVMTFTILDEVVLVEPTRNTFVFEGWFDAEEDGVLVELIEIGTVGDVDLYAYWSVLTYTVTFVYNDKEVVVEVEVSGTVAEEDFPSDVVAPEGQMLFYWYYGDEVEFEFTASTIINENYVVYPLFADASTISFDSLGGSLVESITQVIGTHVVAPEAPLKEFYSFVGWFVSLDDEEAYEFDVMPSSDIELFAKWEANYMTVTAVFASEPSTDHTVFTEFVVIGVVAATTDRGYILQDTLTTSMISVFHLGSGFVIGDEVIVVADFNVSFNIARLINVSSSALLSQDNSINYDVDAAVNPDFDNFNPLNYAGQLVRVSSFNGLLTGTAASSYFRLAPNFGSTAVQVYPDKYIGLQNGANNPNLSQDLSEIFVGGTTSTPYPNHTVFVVFYDSTASYQKAVIIGDAHIVVSDDTFGIGLSSELGDAELSVTPDKVEYEFYESVTISASLVEGYDFLHWFDLENDVVFSTAREFTFNVVRTYDLKAIYEEKDDSNGVETFIETFETWNLPGAYTQTTTSVIGAYDIQWSYIGGRNDAGYPIDGATIVFRTKDSSWSPFMESEMIEGGISFFSIDMRKAFTGGSNNRSIKVIIIPEFGEVYEETSFTFWNIGD